MLKFNSEGDAWNCGQVLFEALFERAFPNIKMTLSRDNYSLILRSHFLPIEPEIKDTDKPYIAWSAEPHKVSWRNYSPILDIRSDGPTELIVENNVQVINIPMLVIAYIQYTKAGYSYPHFKNSNRLHCLAYCNSNSISFREDFFRKCRNKIGKRAHGLGKCSNTEGPLPGRWRDHNLFETYSKYNFVMAFENCVKPGYITEKILAAFLAGAIPVYWGDDELAKQIFNEKAFIRVSDFENSEACIDHLIYLESNPEEMEKIRKEPVFKDDQIPEMFDLKSGKYYEDVISHLQKTLSDHLH